MDVSIRAAKEADLDIAAEVVNAAFGPSLDSRIAELRRYLHLQPDGWLLALLAERSVGFGGIVDYGPFGYLGMMAVLPTLQRQGVGKALMQRLTSWGDERGCPTLLLDASLAGAPLYAQFGFVEEDKTASWEGQALLSLPDPLAPHATGSVTLLQPEDISELVLFDARYFGAQRLEAIVSYLPDAAVGGALVARNEHGEITGYLIARPSHHHLGPWVAVDATVAEQLLRRALMVTSQSELYVNVSLRNQDALRLLAHYGFVQLRALSHMRRGQPANFRDLTRIYSQASFALG